MFQTKEQYGSHVRRATLAAVNAHVVAATRFKLDKIESLNAAMLVAGNPFLQNAV